MHIAKAGLCLFGVSALLVLLGYLHHTKLPPAGALAGLGAELAVLFSGYLGFRR